MDEAKVGTSLPDFVHFGGSVWIILSKKTRHKDGFEH